MNNGMVVDSVELRNVATALRKYANEMSETLDDSTQTINGTAASWESQSAEVLRGRYTALSAKFSDFYTAIGNYATFLDNVAASYETADKKIEQNANDLLNQGYDGAAS